uniref:Bifunctional inhibitor/plant lipid transfer protein/seed storage helical domain-containing protein n=1 Tax=Oryza punctata TaxID=4537 RepID=A0A0E0ML09_ORYPU
MVSLKVAGGVVLLLLLACCAAIPPRGCASDAHPSAKKAPPPRILKCTHAQKVDILRECREWVKNEYPVHPQTIDSECCKAVRAVRNRNMDCIIDLLTSEETNRYNRWRIKELHDMCDEDEL